MRRARGFTLLEMVGVIAVIGVLLALLIPAISSVQRGAAIERTRAQFTRLSLAVETYRACYGRYPPVGTATTVDLRSPTGEALIAALLGQEPDGSALTGEALTLNPQRLVFLEWRPEDFTTDGHLVDAFGNVHWTYVWDHDRTGRVELSELPEVPTHQRPSTALPAGPHWYVAGENGNPWIVSW